MSLGQVASSPQPSAPSAPQQSAPAADAPAAVTPTDAPASPAVPADKPAMGHNGGPDWRAMMAGEDSKALEILSRYQAPQDLTKAFLEQRSTLSKRAEPAKLPDNATPEQMGEWRKGLGLPEVAADAKPDAYLGAYKIEPPKGYEMTAVEKGGLSDYAKFAYEQGHSPREVKAATDFFFQQQAAQQQVLNRVAVDYQKAEQNAWRDAVGSKEYEAQLEAGSAWLQEYFADDQDGLNEMLSAQMPGGGKIGDSRKFGEIIAKLAMGAGFTDRIEANALESGGKSLAQQQAEIEGLQFKDKAAYDAATKTGGKYDSILKARMARGEIDELGNEVRRRRAS